jgi:hypothetical protein
MSKAGPSPRADALREMRERQFAKAKPVKAPRPKKKPRRHK